MGALKSLECSHGHPMEDPNLYHRPDGKRECLTCKRERNKGRKAGDAVIGTGKKPATKRAVGSKAGARVRPLPKDDDGAQVGKVGVGKIGRPKHAENCPCGVCRIGRGELK